MLISNIISITTAVLCGIITGVLTAEQCCVEYRPNLGWIVGILTMLTIWSLLYTVCSESHCAGCKRCQRWTFVFYNFQHFRTSEIVKSSSNFEHSNIHCGILSINTNEKSEILWINVLFSSPWHHPTLVSIQVQVCV